MTRGNKRNKNNAWAIKITVISLALSALISFLSEITADTSSIIVTLLLLSFLILASIAFDGIGVATASCNPSDFKDDAKRRVYGGKTALRLVENNEKVSNVCNDVIGDTFGIISGSCSVAIVLKLAEICPTGWQKLLTIGISSVISAVTIGGKALLKESAITNAKDFVKFVASILAIFDKEEREIKKSVRIQRHEQRKKSYALRQVFVRKNESTIENLCGKSHTERQSHG